MTPKNGRRGISIPSENRATFRAKMSGVSLKCAYGKSSGRKPLPGVKLFQA